MADLLALALEAGRHVLATGTPPDARTTSLLLSKGLGYAVVLGSAMVKMPQIVRVVRKRSAKGLASVTYECEVVGYTVAMLYAYRMNMPFSTYGETTFLLAQDVALLVLLYHYQRTRAARVLAAFAAYASFVGSLAFYGWPLLVLAPLHASTSMLFVCARLPQIISNHRARSVGELSPTSVCLNFAGNLVRIFTTLRESRHSQSSLFGHSLGALTNGLMVLQLALYRPAASKKAA